MHQVRKERQAFHSLVIEVRVAMQKLATLQMRAMTVKDHCPYNPLAQRQKLPDGVEHVQVPSHRSLAPAKVVLDWHGANAQRQAHGSHTMDSRTVDALRTWESTDNTTTKSD